MPRPASCSAIAPPPTPAGSCCRSIKAAAPLSSTATALAEAQGAAYASGNAPPEWLKLVRSGDSFSAFVSSDGTTWTQVGSSITVDLASTALVGLAVDSFSTDTLNTAAFQNVTVSGQAPTASGDGSVTINNFNNSTVATITLNGQSSNVYLTQFAATLDANGYQYAFDTFCIDLDHLQTLGQTSAAFLQGDLDTAFAAGARMAYIYQKYGTVDLTGDPDEAAAIQTALWVLEEDPAPRHLASTRPAPIAARHRAASPSASTATLTRLRSSPGSTNS